MRDIRLNRTGESRITDEIVVVLARPKNEQWGGTTTSKNSYSCIVVDKMISSAG